MNDPGLDLFHRLYATGYRFRLDGEDRVKIRAPRGLKLAEEDAAGLRANRARVIELLQAQEEQVNEVTEALRGNGWAVIKSLELKEDVLWVGERANIPKEHAKLVAYTAAELKRLIDGSYTPENLRDVHDFKRMFPGASLEEFHREVTG